MTDEEKKALEAQEAAKAEEAKKSADPDKDDAASKAGDSVDDKGNDDTQPETYTMEQVQEMVQKASADAVETFKAEAEARAKEEADKAALEALPEEEKTKVLLNQKEKELIEREARIEKQERENFAAAELAKVNMPVTMVAMVTGENNEMTAANVAAMNSAFNALYEERVKGIINVDHIPPKNSESQLASKDFGDLTTKERQLLRKENPELYNAKRKAHIKR